jgi:peptide/nickel transport system substrate-binding protein
MTSDPRLLGALDRRAFLKRSGSVAGGLGLLGWSGALAACGDSGSSSSSEPISDTLRYAFLADMQVPDPDIFYEGEGLQVTLSVYEGLVQYAADAAHIAPALAESWEISPDALTYTFHLRSGVTFHDGTPMDAASFVKSFERRTNVNQGPAYMLADVASAEAPDATTLVVTLVHPVQPFMHFLACPWGPKAVSPTAVAANEVDGDFAQKWLETHDAGTGPYTISEFVPSSHYSLTAYDGYWGTKPEFTNVEIEILPDVTTQRLKLERGELDIVTKGLPITDVESFSGNDDFTVTKLGMGLKEAIWVNATSGIFADKELRQALRVAIDRPAVIEPSFKDTAKVSTEFYPAYMFPEGLATDNPTTDPSVLAALVENLDSKKVDLAYDEQGGATDRRAAELIQTQLQAVGLDVTVRGMPTSQTFALYDTPQEQRPDLLLALAGGDTLHPDTVLRIVYRTGAAPLNWFNYSVPAVDEEMDLGLESTTVEEANEHYAKAAATIIDEALIVNLADLQDVIIMRAGITGLVHDPMALHVVRLAELKKA